MSLTWTNPFVSALLGLAVGLVAGWLWRNLRTRALDRELASCRPRAARLAQVEEILAERNGQLAALQTELGDLRDALAKSPPAPPAPAPQLAQAAQQAPLPLAGGETPKRRKSRAPSTS